MRMIREPLSEEDLIRMDRDEQARIDAIRGNMQQAVDDQKRHAAIVKKAARKKPNPIKKAKGPLPSSAVLKE